MTPEELIEKVMSGVRIKCDKIWQRRAVLEFFDESGIPIGSMTRRDFLEVPVEQDKDMSYMHPGYDSRRKYIVIYFSAGEIFIKYEEIKNIIENAPLLLDDRNDMEFARDFASLLYGRERV